MQREERGWTSHREGVCVGLARSPRRKASLLEAPRSLPAPCELPPAGPHGNACSVRRSLQNKTICVHIAIKQIGDMFGSFKEFGISDFENRCNNAKQILTS